MPRLGNQYDLLPDPRSFEPIAYNAFAPMLFSRYPVRIHSCSINAIPAVLDPLVQLREVVPKVSDKRFRYLGGAVGYVSYDAVRFWDRLPLLGRPALFIWGDRDWLVPVAFEDHVMQALPQAESVIIEDCGHVPQIERPVRFNRVVEDFLGRRGTLS